MFGKVKEYVKTNIRRSVVGLFATMILLIPWGISPIQNLGISIYLTICIIPIYAILDYVVDKWSNRGRTSVHIVEMDGSTSKIPYTVMDMRDAPLDVSTAHPNKQLK